MEIVPVRLFGMVLMLAILIAGFMILGRYCVWIDHMYGADDEEDGNNDEGDQGEGHTD